MEIDTYQLHIDGDPLRWADSDISFCFPNDPNEEMADSVDWCLSDLVPENSGENQQIQLPALKRRKVKKGRHSLIHEVPRPPPKARKAPENWKESTKQQVRKTLVGQLRKRIKALIAEVLGGVSATLLTSVSFIVKLTQIDGKEHVFSISGKRSSEIPNSKTAIQIQTTKSKEILMKSKDIELHHVLYTYVSHFLSTRSLQGILHVVRGATKAFLIQCLKKEVREEMLEKIPIKSIRNGVDAAFLDPLALLELIVLSFDWEIVPENVVKIVYSGDGRKSGKKQSVMLSVKVVVSFKSGEGRKEEKEKKRKKEEGGRKKEEGGRKKEEEGRNLMNIFLGHLPRLVSALNETCLPNCCLSGNRNIREPVSPF